MKYLSALLLAASTLMAGVLAPDLAQKLQTIGNDEPLWVFVFPKDQPEYGSLKAMFTTKKQRVDYLKDFADRTQRPILSYLYQATDGRSILEYKPYWVVNAIRVRATKAGIQALAQLPSVGYIEEEPEFHLVNETPADAANAASPTPGWNISKVNADDVWNLGYTGEGVIIGQLDTGVDASHPAFHGRFAGYWFDACNGQPNPYDDNGHGTHTMGSAVGGDGPGPDPDDIGVAPGARFTAAKIFTGSGNACDIMAAFQWYATLVADSGVPVRVINNSWGSPSQTSLAYWSAVLTWRSLDIIPVFAVGNDGPGSGTAGTPGNYPTVIGVGATDASDNIASFSSRGPAPNQSPWNDPQYWPRSDWNLIKPDISAPGVNIRSSVPGGGYQGGYTWSGTSMATPHVTGVVALLLQKNPTLTFDEVYNILTNTAYEPGQGAPYPNNDYGWGRVDALAAIEQVPDLDQPSLQFVGTEVTSGGDSQIDPGETPQVTVYLTNLSPVTAQNAQGTLRTTSSYVTLNDSTAAFGDIAQGDTVGNTTPFTFVVDAGAPSGTNLDFTLHVTATTDSGTYETDLTFSLQVGLPRSDYLDIHAGNATLTVTDIAALGFMSSDQMQGSGFVYPAGGENTLFYGTFAVGTSPSYVADAWYQHGSDDRDFEPTTDPPGQLYYYPTPPWGSAEAAWGQFEDTGHPTPQGIRVEQIAAGYADPTYDDFVILVHNIYSPVDGAYAGYFMDFDIGGSNFGQNTAGVSEGANLAYMTYGGTYVGLALLDPDTPANLSVINNPTYVYPDTGMLDENKWQFLNGTLSFSSGNTPDDWSVMVSGGPFNAGLHTIAVAVVGGNSLLNIIQNAQNAKALYDSVVVAVEEGRDPGLPVFFGLQRVSPNPVRDRLTVAFTLPDRAPVQIALYDAAGRQVRRLYQGTLNRGSHTLTLPVGNLSQGVYFLRLTTPFGTRTRTFAKIR